MGRPGSEKAAKSERERQLHRGVGDTSGKSRWITAPFLSALLRDSVEAQSCRERIEASTRTELGCDNIAGSKELLCDDIVPRDSRVTAAN